MVSTITRASASQGFLEIAVRLVRFSGFFIDYLYFFLLLLPSSIVFLYLFFSQGILN